MKAKFISPLMIVLFVVTKLSAQNVEVGDEAPSFTLDKFGGGMLSSSDFPDKVLFIYFFGST